MSNLCVFNSLFKEIDFSDEKSYKSIIKSYFMQLWQLDNVVLLFGAGSSKYLGGPLMKELSESILPPLIMEGYERFINTEMETMWDNLWEMNQLYFTDNTINEEGIKHIGDINIETKLSELKMLSYSLSILKFNIEKNLLITVWKI